MNADGGDVHAIIEPLAEKSELDLRQARYSPDGALIAFQEWDQGAGAMRLYVMAADGAGRRQVVSDPDADFLARPVWSNDGTRTAAQSVRDLPSGETDLCYAITNVEDGSLVATGPRLPTLPSIEWAPDDSKLLMVPNQESSARQLILDPAGGPWTEVPWDSDSYPSWQRLAP